jgi:hypothetical protein
VARAQRPPGARGRGGGLQQRLLARYGSVEETIAAIALADPDDVVARLAESAQLATLTDDVAAVVVRRER